MDKWKAFVFRRYIFANFKGDYIRRVEVMSIDKIVCEMRERYAEFELEQLSWLAYSTIIESQIFRANLITKTVASEACYRVGWLTMVDLQMVKANLITRVMAGLAGEASYCVSENCTKGETL